MAARRNKKATSRAAPPGAAAAPSDDVAAAGWNALSERLAAGRYRMSDAYIAMLMKKLEDELHECHGGARYRMHEFLVTLARHRPHLVESTLAAADRIGRFTIDGVGEVHARGSIEAAQRDAPDAGA